MPGQLTSDGVTVHSGDVVVADEEGVVGVPGTDRERILQAASARAAAEDAESLDEWQPADQAKSEKLIR